MIDVDELAIDAKIRVRKRLNETDDGDDDVCPNSNKIDAPYDTVYNVPGSPGENPETEYKCRNGEIIENVR